MKLRALLEALPQEESPFLKQAIFSVSGIRARFSALTEGERPNSEPDELFFAAAVALSASKLFSPSLPIVLGRDARKSGPALLDVAQQVLEALGFTLWDVGVAPICEVSAFTRESAAQGFFYVTASHNPPEDNGFKIGDDSGAVVGKDKADPLILHVKELLENPALWGELFTPTAATGHLESDKNRQQLKSESLKAYRASLEKSGIPGFPSRKGELKGAPPLPLAGIAIDFNGSARAASLDRAILEEWGFATKVINDIPTEGITHGILPEGENLKDVKNLLSSLQCDENGFFLGYMPDCDGDRGNLVYISAGKTKQLSPQETFALSVLAHFALLRAFSLGLYARSALVANDCTSLKTAALMKRLNRPVFTAEVGEANLTSKTRELQEEGRFIPVFGEGSNGGSISFRTQVRDPLATLKVVLMYLRSLQRSLTARMFYSSLFPENAFFDEGLSLGEILARVLGAFDPYVTTTTGEPQCQMQLERSASLVPLRQAFFKRAHAGLGELQKKLPRLPIASFEILQVSGGIETRDGDPLPSGGTKLLLLDKKKKPLGFLWWRPSGTEPLVRVMADLYEGTADELAEAIAWERSLLERAQSSTKN